MDTLFEKLFFNSKHSETSLIRKFSGSQSFLKNNNGIFQNIPSEYQQLLFENNLFSSNYNTASSVKSSKVNQPFFFRKFNYSQVTKLPNSAVLMQEYLRFFSSPLDMIVNLNPDFCRLWDSDAIPMKKEVCKLVKGTDKESLTDQMTVPLNEITVPTINSHMCVSVSKNVLKPVTTVKINTQKDCSLDKQLANRKTKEMQKRSKKRRRRQKKCDNQSNETYKDIKNEMIQVKCETPSSKHTTFGVTFDQKEKCDIICDMRHIHCESNSVQIILPELSSFVVTVESGGEDDSDWDSNCDADWYVDDTEFQVSGLFVANFTACAKPAVKKPSDIPCDSELDLIQTKLREINKSWDDSTKYLEMKKKSTTLISFAPDDKLVNTFPVEMYERKGEWEIYATERQRFKKRINELEGVLSPCFSQEHRAKIYFNLYKTVL